ncbi:DUF4337 family protein [Sphingobium sp. EM0848]|uniref:DUF4337 family protein n=1 Tax=Sphingobium sp. EM0848 TaxID=2743473 RepID=UPI00350F8962
MVPPIEQVEGDGSKARAALTTLDSEIAKYQAEAPGLERQAKQYRQDYDAPNIHDDQFNASDALIATAISLRCARAWGCCLQAGPSARSACSWGCAVLPGGPSTRTCLAIS